MLKPMAIGNRCSNEADAIEKAKLCVIVFENWEAQEVRVAAVEKYANGCGWFARPVKFTVYDA